MSKSHHKLKILRTADPKSAFGNCSARDILQAGGPLSYLLGSSTKLDKCGSVGVLARVLYLTPGILCPAASAGCLRACLGHSSGRMAFPSHAAARDRRTALYLEEPRFFITRLRAELFLLEADALRLGRQPAARLNGSSDLAWEERHAELIEEFSNMQFYDYTKSVKRVRQFLGTGKQSAQRKWPKNYHLTFSGESANRRLSQPILDAGGNVAIAFWPALPSRWLGYPVLDGEAHDARFQDPPGHVVGLRAKGTAKVDVTGFTARPCPDCHDDETELDLTHVSEDGHRQTLHRCAACGYELHARCKVA